MEDVNLEHTKVQDGGGVRGFYSVWLTGPTHARLRNFEVSNSGSSGMSFSQSFEDTLHEFSNNRFFGNKFHGVILGLEAAGISKLDSTTDFIGNKEPNGTQNIVVEGFHLGAGEQLTLPSDTNGTFLFTNAVTLDDNGTPSSDNAAKLSIVAGTRVEFSYLGQIYVRSGVLSINGTVDDPVVLTGVLGGDDEIKFHGISGAGTDDIFRSGKAKIELENVVINHGGLPLEDDSPERGAISVGGDTLLSLTNVAISDSVSFGVSCHEYSGRAFTPENLSTNNVSFSNNGSDDYGPFCGK